MAAADLRYGLELWTGRAAGGPVAGGQ